VAIRRNPNRIREASGDELLCSIGCHWHPEIYI
jgi:hypothetical protein